MTDWKVEIVKPESPIKWEGFDENGNYGRIYENGCETWLSKELIEDDLEESPYLTDNSVFAVIDEEAENFWYWKNVGDLWCITDKNGGPITRWYHDPMLAFKEVSSK